MAVIGLSLLLGVVLAIALAYKFSQVLKAPTDRPLRAVTLCLSCAAAAFPFGLTPVAEEFDALTLTGAGELIQNALLLCTVYWLMCFYLYSAADAARGRARARWETLPLAFALAVITVATVMTSEHLDERTYDGVDMRVTGFALFYLVAGLYLVYALATALRWTVPYARMSTRPLSTGLWLVAGSMAGMVLAGSVRSVVVVIRWCGGEVPEALTAGAALLLALVVPLFVVGVSYPGVATRLVALRIWWQHRRTYRRLGPLWLLLHEAYPQDALNRVPTGRWSDRLLVRGVHRRYYRRVIECRDGLVRISPRLAQLDPERREATPPSPTVLATRLRAALDTSAAGGTVTSRAVPVAMPLDDGLEADVRQLVALSEALRTTGSTPTR